MLPLISRRDWLDGPVLGDLTALQTERRMLSSTLPPIVNEVDIRSVVTGLVGPVHRHPLKICPKVTLKHPTIGFVTSRIDTGHQAGQAPSGGQLFTGIKQTVEILLRSWSGAHCPELDVAHSASSLCIGSAVTHG